MFLQNGTTPHEAPEINSSSIPSLALFFLSSRSFSLWENSGSSLWEEPSAASPCYTQSKGRCHAELQAWPSSSRPSLSPAGWKHPWQNPVWKTPRCYKAAVNPQTTAPTHTRFDRGPSPTAAHQSQGCPWRWGFSRLPHTQGKCPSLVTRIIPISSEQLFWSPGPRCHYHKAAQPCHEPPMPTPPKQQGLG